MISQLQKHPVNLFQILVLLSVLLLAVSLAGPILTESRNQDSHFIGLMNSVVNGFAITGLVFAAARTIKVSRLAALIWAIFALGQFINFAGDILSPVFGVIFPQTDSSSFFNGIYLIYYPVVFTGIMLFPLKKYSPVEGLKHILDISIVMVAGILGYLNFIVFPVTKIAGAFPVIDQIASFVFPLGDLLLLFALLTMPNRQNENHSEAATTLMMVGLSIFLIDDVVLSFQLITQTYIQGRLLDVFYLLSYLLIALAGFSQGFWVKHDPKAYPPEAFFRAISNKALKSLPIFPYLMLVAAYALLIQSYLNPVTIGFVPTAVGVAIMIALVIARQLITDSENKRLTSQLQTSLSRSKDQAGELARMNQSLQVEVTERTRIEEKLSYDALHDWLTGLPNRVLFSDRLERAIEYSHDRPDYVFSILFLDIDLFKVINDSLGHTIGDKLLVLFSRRLADCFRTNDTVARLGGDEFVILLENTQGQEAVLNVAERVRKEMAVPFKLENREVYITVSIGVVLNLVAYSSPEEVLRDADIAMYQAKMLGKDRVEIFQAGLRVRAASRLEIENDLRNAIERAEFLLNYQPIVDIRSSRVTGFEALIRWKHPRRGLLPPLDFISAAEDTGLIIPIGRWVLVEACAQLKRWQAEFPACQNLVINVNISGRQFAQPDFIDQVEQALLATQLSPSFLKLEITESVLIDNYSLANQVFEALARLGVQLEIDDFGTGYSSLSYLQHFTIHTIKIDKSFIRSMGQGGKGSELVRAIILMAQDLGMETIAEGVETETQLKELQGLACPYAQGYFFSKPLDEEAAELFLRGQCTLPGNNL